MKNNLVHVRSNWRLLLPSFAFEFLARRYWGFYPRHMQPRSQGLSPLPPLSLRKETLVAAGHVPPKI